MKLLALDFDGVICDSSREIFRVTLETCAALAPALPVAGLLDVCRRWSSPQAFDGDPVYRGFVDLLPLGNRAEDFAVALKAVMEGRRLSDQTAYDRYFAVQEDRWKADFQESFYHYRTAVRAESEADWLALHGTWPEFVELLKARTGSVEYAVCTAKDTVSVRKLLRHFGIDDLFADDRILDKEIGAQKTAHLAELARRTGVDPGQITFVDDKVSHLQKVSTLGVRCVLAAWGDNGDREHALARGEGFAVASLSDAEDILFTV